MSDGPEVAVEVDNPGGNIVRRFVRGDGPDELIAWYEGSGTTTRRLTGLDERNSIVSATDSSGALIGINAYDEYGIPAASNIGRMQYTGQMWLPEANVTYSKARNLLTHLGVFAQTDPIGPADDPTQDWARRSEEASCARPRQLARLPPHRRDRGLVRRRAVDK